jgi:outer membrane protein TolC
LQLCLLLAATAWVTAPLRGQGAAQATPQNSRATQLPLSGRESQAPSVTVTQRTTNSGGGNTVDVIDSSVTVQGPYAGSVPGGPAAVPPVALTLERALSMGLRTNLGAISQSAAVEQAQGQRSIARSELMPQLNTTAGETFERLNLRTQGVEIASFPEAVKFNYFDARAARLTQSVVDLVRIHNLHSATETLNANLKAVRNARDLIVLAVGGGYLQLIATKARIDATASQVRTDQAIYQQAADRLTAGLGTRVDVTRSQVQLQTEQQRLRSLQADLDTERLRLARIIGLPLGQQFTAADNFLYAPLTQFTVDSALTQAYAVRPDLQAATSNVKAAEDTLRAAHAERLPSLGVTADFGASGITPSHQATGVYTVTGLLTIPLYEGGRIHGDIEQAEAALRQRKAEFEDLRGQIDQDVRQAFIDLGSAADQVDVARSNVLLAEETLEQSRDRFIAGVTDTVEVVQAEQTLAQANDDLITAGFEHNLAKVSLARALGNAEQILPQLLRRQ